MNSASSQEAGRLKVQRAALTHALCLKQILLCVNPRKSAAKILLYFNLITQHPIRQPYLQSSQFDSTVYETNLDSSRLKPAPACALRKVNSLGEHGLW